MAEAPITEMELWFPELPDTQEGVRQRWSRSRYRKYWHRLTADMLLMAGWRQNMEPWQELSVIYTRCSSAEPEYDNLVISFKSIQDAFQLPASTRCKCGSHAGLIPDDSNKHIPLQVHRWEKASRADSGVRVKLWRLS